MKVVVVGVGYVGLTTAAALAELGNQVIGLDIDPRRIAMLRGGELPLYEPALQPLVLSCVKHGNLAFEDDYNVACTGAEIIFITVDTPTAENWEIRLDSLRAVAASLAKVAPPEAIIVLKSTVPPGSNEYFRRLFREAHPQGREPIVVSNPEFLREGQAVFDTFHPDRIVLGTNDQQGLTAMRELYEPIIHGRYTSEHIPAAPENRATPVPVVATEPPTAELIKYAANAFLATKISFINEIANLSEELGADVTVVAEGIGLDTRIGKQFLRAGLGFGGSCFPKDTKALSFKAGTRGYNFVLLNAVIEVNKLQRYRFINRIRQAFGTSYPNITLAILGLAFKPHTDDIRESPAIDIMKELHQDGVKLRATDPVAMSKAAETFQDATYIDDPLECMEGCDGVVLCTEWPQYSNLDWVAAGSSMTQLFCFDGRNHLDPATIRAAGFSYYGVGRE